MTTKKWMNWLVLTVFALVGMAQAMECGTKTVRINVPSNWAGLYINIDGQFTLIPSTFIVNGWYVIPLQNYGSQYASNWFFSSSGSDWNANKITKVDYNAPGDQNDKFTCNDFGLSETMYISEDLNRPNKTFLSLLPPNAKYLYFLPPDEPEWFQGVAQIVINGGAPIPMDPDPVRCGWFRMVYFNETPPANVVFTLDVNPEDFQVGANGVEDDIPVPIDLDAKFTQVNPSGTNLFFNAEEGALGWTADDPGEQRQCSYQMAAFIYDTDAALHGAFSCDNYPNVATTSCYAAGVTWPGQTGIPCIGVTKGIVQPTLGPGRKPVYNTASGCFQSANHFNQLFDSVPGVNQKHCRDLSFERSLDGLWEFDSYNEPGKGYYPLEDQPNVLGQPGYKRNAYGGILMGTGGGVATLADDNVNALALTQYAGTPPTFSWAAINPATGVPYIDTYPTQHGEFATGTNPNVYNNEGWGNCPNASKPGVCREAHTLGKNQHFCFETHAEFVFRPGQKFYFRGDDDIWVFINNKLVVDLGGMHLAAPGYVVLDTIGVSTAAPLIQGATYPIDIFFCDRRTDMSNIRIKTNMYFEQRSGLFFLQSGNTFNVAGLQTGGGSCGALNQTTDTIPGPQLDLSYWLVTSRGDTLHPSGAKVPFAQGGPYYGGITIGNGTFTLNENQLAGLAPGRYRLVVVNNVTRDRAQRIFRIAGSTGFWSVNNVATDVALDARPAAQRMAGKVVPFEVANKSGEFVDETDAAFQLSIPVGLEIYYDSLKTQPVTNTTTINTGDDGIIKLWATGTRSAPTDTTYGFNIRGSRDTLFMRFYLPVIAFVDSTAFNNPVFANADILGTPKPALSEDGDTGYAYVNYSTWLVALDPTTGERCLDCNDPITIVTTDTLAFANGNPSGASALALENGQLRLFVRGLALVLNGSFTVVGPSPAITTNWTPINLIPPPVPIIDSAAMFDVNGDGRADSLVYWFDRSIATSDSTPDSLLIYWPDVLPDTFSVIGRDQVRLGISPDGLTWSMTADFTDQKLTGALGTTTAWFTFTKNGRVNNLPITATIQDRMPPMIDKAIIRIGSTKSTVRQFDTLQIIFTEPMDTTGVVGVPFQYILLSEAGLVPDTASPTLMFWSADLRSVRLFYDPDLRHPRMGDSVRVIVDPLRVTLRDKRGNVVLASNPFVLIEGAKRSEVATLPLTQMDPATIIQRWGTTPPTFLTTVGMYEDIGATKQKLTQQYGSILGHLVQIDMSAIYSDSIIKMRARSRLGRELQPSDVKLKIETQYFTNLGTYVAGGNHTIPCYDGAAGSPSQTLYGPGGCTGVGNGYIFVGWNLRSDDKRVVGSGAYVARLHAYVTVEGIGTISTTMLDKNSLWGVIRKQGATGIILGN